MWGRFYCTFAHRLWPSGWNFRQLRLCKERRWGFVWSSGPVDYTLSPRDSDRGVGEKRWISVIQFLGATKDTVRHLTGPGSNASAYLGAHSVDIVLSWHTKKRIAWNAAGESHPATLFVPLLHPRKYCFRSSQIMTLFNFGNFGAYQIIVPRKWDHIYLGHIFCDSSTSIHLSWQWNGHAAIRLL